MYSNWAGHQNFVRQDERRERLNRPTILTYALAQAEQGSDFWFGFLVAVNLEPSSSLWNLGGWAASFVAQPGQLPREVPEMQKLRDMLYAMPGKVAA